MKVLITGGAGFIGSSVYDEFKKLYDVYIVDNFTPFYDIKQKITNLEINSSILKKERVQNIFNCDIRDYFAMKKIISEIKPQAIIHCAAMAGIQQSFEHPKEYFSVNVEGTFNIFSIASELKIKKVLFLSSSSVYGDSHRAPFKENFSLNPISPYGMTKMQDETMALFFSKQANLHIVNLRLFTLYGPRQRPDLILHKMLLNHINKRESVVYKKTFRDYTYISDGVNGIKRAFEYLMDSSCFETFNIGSSKSIETIDVVKEIKKIYPNFKYIETEKKKGEMTRTFADISKAEKILGYKPEMNFKDGIKRFFLWFNNYYKI